MFKIKRKREKRTNQNLIAAHCSILKKGKERRRREGEKKERKRKHL